MTVPLSDVAPFQVGSVSSYVTTTSCRPLRSRTSPTRPLGLLVGSTVSSSSVSPPTIVMVPVSLTLLSMVNSSSPAPPVTLSPPPATRSSSPRPPSIVSAPSPPSIVSDPSPPVRLSEPAPPSMLSSPPPPSIVSSPSPASTVSSPSPRSRSSLPPDPVTLSPLSVKAMFSISLNVAVSPPTVTVPLSGSLATLADRSTVAPVLNAVRSRTSTSLSPLSSPPSILSLPNPSSSAMVSLPPSP